MHWYLSFLFINHVNNNIKPEDFIKLQLEELKLQLEQLKLLDRGYKHMQQTTIYSLDQYKLIILLLLMHDSLIIHLLSIHLMQQIAKLQH